MTVRRVLLSLMVLALAIVVARWPQPTGTDTGRRLIDLREEIASRWTGAAIRYPLPPGAAPLRLLVNVDQRGATPPAGGMPLTARITRGSDGATVEYPLWAEPGTDDRGDRAVLYLDGDEWPSRTATLGIQRSGAAGDTLTVTFAGLPAAATASVRLLVPEARAAFRGRSLGHPEVGFAPASAQGRARSTLTSTSIGPGAAEIADQAWAKVAPATGTPTRRIYFRDSATRPALPPPPPRLGAAQVVALTLQGPGAITLQSSGDAVVGSVQILQADAVERSVPVVLSPGASQRMTLTAGLQTLRLPAALATNLRVRGTPDVAGALAVVHSDGSDDAELSPRWVYEEFFLAQPSPATPVVLSLAGRNASELLLRVRALMKPGLADHAVQLRFQMVRADGRVLDTRSAELTAQPAPEDVAGDLVPLGLSAPISVYLWPSPGADSVRIIGSEPVALAAASPGWNRDGDVPPGPRADDDNDADADADLSATDVVAPTLRLRFGAPQARRAFFPVAPSNRSQLIAEGRAHRFQFAPRLEKRPPPSTRPSPSLAPFGMVPRRDLLVSLTRPARPGARGLYWSLPANQDVRLGSRASPPTLLYLGGQGARRGAARISLDGRLVGSEPLFTARGRLRLPLPGGAHRLRVDVPPGVQLLISRPVEATAPRRFLSVYPIDPRRGLNLRVPKGAARRTVGVVLYGQGPTPGQTQLRYLVDGGRRRNFVHVSQDRSSLVRTLAVAARALPGAKALNTGVAPTWVSEPMFIPLGDDLAAGVHGVRLHGPPSGRVLARLFLVEPETRGRPVVRALHVGRRGIVDRKDARR